VIAQAWDSSFGSSHTSSPKNIPIPTLLQPPPPPPEDALPGFAVTMFSSTLDLVTPLWRFWCTQKL